MPPTEPVPSCAVELLPSDEWEREVLSTFVELRQARKTCLSDAILVTVACGGDVFSLLVFSSSFQLSLASRTTGHRVGDRREIP